MGASWVFVFECGYVVDEAGDEDQGAGLGLFLDCKGKVSGVRVWDGEIRTGIPGDDGEVVRVHGPFDAVGLGLELLEFHGELTLLDFVLGESLEVGCQTEPLHGDDEPFRGVVLVPLDRVPVVHGELMMEVVVAFSDGDESGKEVVARGVLVVKGRVTEVMGERVDAERGMMDEG